MRVIDCWEFPPVVVYGDRRRGPYSTPYRFFLEIVEASKAIPVQDPKTCANTSRPYDFNKALPDIGSKVEHVRIRYILPRWGRTSILPPPCEKTAPFPLDNRCCFLNR